MRIGFSQKIITPQHPCMLAGYDAERTMSGIHDDLYVKVIVMEDQGRLSALIVYDLIAVDHLLKTQISKCLDANSLSMDKLYLCAIHTHSGPMGVLDSEHGFLRSTTSFMGKTDQAYIEKCRDLSVQALLEAYDMLDEGSLLIASGQAKGIGSNRNDPNLSGNEGLCLLEARSGHKKALITIYSCHPTVLGAKNTLCSADFCGAYAKEIEQLGYEISVFLNGSCGDISTRFMRQGSGFDEVDRIGKLLAKQSNELFYALKPMSMKHRSSHTVSFKLKAKPAKPLNEVREQIEKLQIQLQDAIAHGITGTSLRVKEIALEAAKAQERYTMYDDGIPAYEVTIEFVMLDQEIFVGIPGELFSELSNPYDDGHTHFIGYVNGYHMYFANQAAYENHYYEAASSPFAYGESERMMKQIEAKIKEWRNQYEQ